MPDQPNTHQPDIAERLARRGRAELLEKLPHLSDQDRTKLVDDAKIGQGYAYDMLSEKGVPGVSILHRLPPIHQKEVLIEAIQTEEDLDYVAAATDEIEAMIDVVFKDPSPEVLAFYKKKVAALGIPQKDPLQMAIEAEQERGL